MINKRRHATIPKYFEDTALDPSTSTHALIKKLEELENTKFDRGSKAPVKKKPAKAKKRDSGKKKDKEDDEQRIGLMKLSGWSKVELKEGEECG